MIQSNPIPPGWVTHKLEIVILQRFSHRSKSSEPHGRLPSLEVWHREDKPPEHLALMPAGFNCRSLTRLGERDFTLKGRTQNPMCTGTQSKNVNLIGAWARPTCWSWRVSWRDRAAMAQPGDIDIGGRDIGKYPNV